MLSLLGISLPAYIKGTAYVTVKELGHEKSFPESPPTTLGMKNFLLLLSYFHQLQFKVLASPLLCSYSRTLSESHFCEGYIPSLAQRHWQTIHTSLCQVIGNREVP